MAYSLYGVHVDETSYNEKVRLEVPATFLKCGAQVSKYLATKEIGMDFDVNSFLTTREIRSIKNLKLLPSEKVLDVIKDVLANFQLNLSNLAYFMSENCNTM